MAGQNYSNPTTLRLDDEQWEAVERVEEEVGTKSEVFRNLIDEHLIADRQSDITVLEISESTVDDIEALAQEMGCSVSEAIERIVFVSRVLFSDQVSISDALKPIPDIVEEVDGTSVSEQMNEANVDGAPVLSCEECDWEWQSTEGTLQEAIDAYENHSCGTPTLKSNG